MEGPVRRPLFRAAPFPPFVALHLATLGNNWEMVINAGIAGKETARAPKPQRP